MISLSLNFFLSDFFDLVDGVEVDGVFSSGEVFSVEGFWSSAEFLVIVDFLGDGVFLVEDFFGTISIGGVGSFIGDSGGVCVGDMGADVTGETDGVFEGG